MNKKHIIILSAIAVMATAAALLPKDNIIFNRIVDAAEQTTTFTINSSVTASEEYTSATYTHEENTNFVLNFDFVKAGGGVGTIKGGSKITRGEITRNIKSVKVDFTGGELKFNTKFTSDDPIIREYTLVSGEEKTNLIGNYFYFNAADQSKDVVINSITLTFGCVPGTEVATPANYKELKKLKDDANLGDIFTWDEPLYNKSYYGVVFNFKELVWTNDFYLATVVAGNKNGLSYLQSNNDGHRLPLESIRVTPNGHGFVLVYEISGANYKDSTHLFFPHLSFHFGWFDGIAGDLKGDNSSSNITYNGTALWKTSQANNDNNKNGNEWPDAAESLANIGGLHENAWGSYQCWQQWGMAGLTITKK